MNVANPDSRQLRKDGRARCLNHLRRGHGRSYGEDGAIAEGLARRLRAWEVDRSLRRGTQVRLLGVTHDADHLQVALPTPEADHRANGISSREELLRDVLADDRHGRRAAHVPITEVA